MKPNELLAFTEALNGDRGELDAWLECHIEAEVREAIATILRRERRDALKEAAKVCDYLCHPRGWRAESNEWIEGTEDCASAIRALIEKEKK